MTAFLNDAATNHGVEPVRHRNLTKLGTSGCIVGTVEKVFHNFNLIY